MRFRTLALALALFGAGSIDAAAAEAGESFGSPRVLHDAARDREIPIMLYPGAGSDRCAKDSPCAVALVSPGYGIEHTRYSFLAAALNRVGYLVVAVQHQLPSDEPLAVGENLFAARTPNWQRGAENLRFVMDALSTELPGYRWAEAVLIGHSNGGDLSAWYSRSHPDFGGTLVTLDHRRVPLPRSHFVRVLSIRASDFPADDGVLPTPEDAAIFGTCVSVVDSARHNDMHDDGPQAIKSSIVEALRGFLRDGACVQ